MSFSDGSPLKCQDVVLWSPKERTLHSFGLMKPCRVRCPWCIALIAMTVHLKPTRFTYTRDSIERLFGCEQRCNKYLFDTLGCLLRWAEQYSESNIVTTQPIRSLSHVFTIPRDES
jgi:hypothetical protein